MSSTSTFAVLVSLSLFGEEIGVLFLKSSDKPSSDTGFGIFKVSFCLDRNFERSGEESCFVIKPVELFVNVDKEVPII